MYNFLNPILSSNEITYSDLFEILNGLLDKSIKEQDREQDMWSAGYQCALFNVAQAIRKFDRTGVHFCE